MYSNQKINYNQAKYILYGFLLFYIIIAASTVIVTSQNVGWDAGLCLKMTDNGYKHIPFNNYAHPSPQNLNEDDSEFVTWWSPGQFAVPLFIQKCFGIRVSVALKILTITCLLISIFGIYNLFNQLIPNKNAIAGDGSPTTIIIFTFLIFTIVQPFFWGNLFAYDGGGILMLAYCPWFIYWVIKLNRINIYNLSMLLILGFIGFFFKTSFTSIFLGSLLYLFLSKSISPDISLKNHNLKKIILNGICLLAVLAIYIFIIKTAFLNHNRNISDSSPGIRMQPRILAFPIVAPIFGLFSLEFLNRTYTWIIGSIFILPVYYLMLKSNSINLLYKYVLISFVATCIGFYFLLNFLNVDVSYELRHYSIITILLTPAFFMSLWRFRLAKYFIIILMALYSATNVYQYAKNLLLAINDRGPICDFSGLPTMYPIDLIKKMHSLDNLKDNGKDIFYFKSGEPSIALEIRNNRVLLEDNFINFHFNNELRFKPALYFGRNSGEIYLIYPQYQFKKDSIFYLNRFEKYKRFENIYQTKGFAIFKAIASGDK